MINGGFCEPTDIARAVRGGAIEILHAAVEHSARIVFMMCAGYDESLWSVFDVGGESGADRIPGLRTGVRC